VVVVGDNVLYSSSLGVGVGGLRCTSGDGESTQGNGGLRRGSCGSRLGFERHVAMRQRKGQGYGLSFA
jgi:hypothetical protein